MNFKGIFNLKPGSNQQTRIGGDPVEKNHVLRLGTRE